MGVVSVLDGLKPLDRLWTRENFFDLVNGQIGIGMSVEYRNLEAGALLDVSDIAKAAFLDHKRLGLFA
jgi:hypothetical protein